MTDYKPPYSVIGISLNKMEETELLVECTRCGLDRAEVIKKALIYWLLLDEEVKDSV